MTTKGKCELPCENPCTPVTIVSEQHYSDGVVWSDRCGLMLRISLGAGWRERVSWEGGVSWLWARSNLLFVSVRKGTSVL